MVLRTMILTGAALATMTAGFAAPAYATPHAAPNATVSVARSAQGMVGFPATSRRGDGSDDFSGLTSESPVCSALGAETIPTGDVVAKCLAGTKVI